MSIYEPELDCRLAPETYTGEADRRLQSVEEFTGGVDRRRTTSDRLVVELTEPTPRLSHEAQAERVRPTLALRAGVRSFDIVAGSAALVFAAPIMGAVAVAVLVTSGRPVIYRSQRYTEGGRRFEILKFRSMCRDADQTLQECLQNDRAMRNEYEKFHKLTHDPRVTPVGSLLRRTSLDELPQLVNVVRGDMSMVGPRPIVEWERDLIGDVAEGLFVVKSGVTGAWQVSGRSNISFVDRVEMELEYVRTRTFLGDLKILVQTVVTVLQRSGAR